MKQDEAVAFLRQGWFDYDKDGYFVNIENDQHEPIADIIECLWPGDWERAVRHLKAHGKVPK